MPRFNVPKADAAPLEAAKVRYQFITQHDDKKGMRILCRLTDVHKRPMLETSASDEEGAFKLALAEFHKRGAAPSPEAIAEENAKLKAEIAALKSGKATTENAAEIPAESIEKRGRGRPPGAKNKPKDNDEGAGNTTQDEHVSSDT